MKVTIFGATGGTGGMLAEKCLGAGHSVTALVRDADKFTARDRCRVVVGDAREATPVLDAVQGADAVMTALGARSPFEKSDLLARAVPQIVAAMQEAQVRRLVALGSGGWQPGAAVRQSAFKRWLLDLGGRTVLRYPIEAQRAQEAVIVPSLLDWTIVAPTRLLNSAPRGRAQVRLDMDALPANASKISRADVADVMFRALEHSEWLRQRVYATW